MYPSLAEPSDRLATAARGGPRDLTPSAPADDSFTVSSARTELEWKEGLRFCGEVYERTYATGWLARPDVLFVVRDAGGPVATGGLELGRLRPSIDVERFYLLSPRMQTFVDANRDRIAEFGRFASSGRTDRRATRAVLQAVVRHCQQEGVEYLFACARPSVIRHVGVLGVPFEVLDVPLDEAGMLSCKGLTAAPVNLFLGDDPARLDVVLISSLEMVIEQSPRRARS
ncbi:MAG: Thermostable hemolysin [Pseudonocardiales bacterium]|nr:Thermostable hemolysin [Pseudonocardiales bacterium]